MEASLPTLFLSLFILLLLSAFFSSSETAMMALDKHRLRHLSNKQNRSAQKAQQLLANQDQLISAILLGNNFVNISASALATLIALKLGGEAYIAAATAILTFVVLIFAEVAPKTIAARHPEAIAFPVSWILAPYLKIMAPLIFQVNIMAKAFLWSLGYVNHTKDESLGSEEIRSIVEGSGQGMGEEHQTMVVRMLDLSKADVEDIMIPRNEVTGINLEQDLPSLDVILANITYTRIPVYHNNLNELKGVLHIRDALRLIARMDPENITEEEVLDACTEPYVIPESINLLAQLKKFREESERLAFIVDEYGSIRGLITLDDILEEIVGDYTSDISDTIPSIQKKQDGNWLISGSSTLREVNDLCSTQLDSEEASTINGLLLNELGETPSGAVCLQFKDCIICTLESTEQLIQSVELIRTTPNKATGKTL